jgi:hypothetical protein
LREEHRLTFSENRVLRTIFVPKREEDGSWIKFHNDVPGALSMEVKWLGREADHSPPSSTEVRE